MKPNNAYQPKFCSHCMDSRPHYGGKYLPVPANPLRQQWFCERCVGLLNKGE